MGVFAPFSFLEKNLEVPSGDPDANAFISAAGITDSTQQSAIQTLVTDLKTAGIWSKFIAFWPFVGGTASQHKYNLIDPRDLDAAYRVTFNGTLTHSSTGVKGDGSTGYYETHIDLNSDLSQNDNFGFVYTRIAAQENKISGYGSIGQTNDCWWQIGSVRNTSNIYNARIYSTNAGVSQITGVTSGAGLFGISRTSSTAVSMNINKSHTSFTRSSVSPNTGQTPYGLCFQTSTGTSAHSANEHAAGGFTNQGLTTSEIDDLYDAVQAYQTTLSREV